MVDLYWSPVRRRWTFCPVNIPANGSPTGSPNTSDPDTSSKLVQLGPYSCSDGLDVFSLVDVLTGFFEHTNSQFNVYTLYVIINTHVAARDSAPDQPAPTLSGDQLPTYAESIDYTFDKLLDSYVYRPSRLAKERSNLNGSWYEVDDHYKPIVQYFTIHENPDGTQSTPDGWPCSKYVELAQQRRVLFGYGTIDAQLGGYNPALDNDVLFPPNYICSLENVSVASDGTLESGCFYRPGETEVSQVNSSWAISSKIPIPRISPTDDTLYELSNMVVNLASCGLSPFLNDTLLNKTADVDIDIYRNISLSATWAWALGEPRDAIGSAGNNGKHRCAIMDLTLAGHWRAVNCTETRFAACRVGNQPFTWKLSNTPATYGGASSVCPDSTSFDVPRTGLENDYLYGHALSQPNDIIDPSSSDVIKREIWLDFNSLDIASCWVTGGPDAHCPYASDPQQLERRTVLVATIAGIVICIVAALMFFVKCNANRRNSRRRRKVIDGWEYEGVPS